MSLFIINKFMITALFEIVSDLDKDNIVYMDMIESIEICFEGNAVLSIVSNVPVYGRVLLCRMDGIKTFFIVLKNKTIFSLDELSNSEIREIIKEYNVIKSFESLKMIRTFANL
jgi:hypothetical protein